MNATKSPKNDLIFKTKTKVDYLIDPINNKIEKYIPGKSDPVQLTYNNLTKMYMDFSKIELNQLQINNIKEYLLTHPFTTFLFSSFNKQKIDIQTTLPELVELLSSKPEKLISTYATSILFLQSLNTTYETITTTPSEELNQKISQPLPEIIKLSLDTFNFLYATMKEGYNYGLFQPITYNDFLTANNAIYRNSTSVEQTLKLINLNIDSNLYKETNKIWSQYLQGKNSQLSFKEAFPILNLTCTYSLYGIQYKDKEAENWIESLKKAAESSSKDSLSKSDIVQNPEGLKLVKKILVEKVNTNVALANLPFIKEYLTTKVDIKNYINDPQSEITKMSNALMKHEHSSNVDLYNIQASELLKHNVEHSINNTQFLLETYNQELPFKPTVPQELQKIINSKLIKNVQTPKIYEQVKASIALPDPTPISSYDDSPNAKQIRAENNDPTKHLTLDQKIVLLEFFHLLNKTAIKTFKEKGAAQVNLPDIFSRYFSLFANYVVKNKENKTQISKMFVKLIERRNELPNWIIREAFDSTNDQRDALQQLNDNIIQIESIAQFLLKKDSDIYKLVYDANATFPSVSYYFNKIMNGTNPKNLEFNEEFDYDLFSFFKNLKIDTKSPNLKEELEQEIGKFIVKYSGNDVNIKKLRDLKTIKNIKSDNLQEYTMICNSLTKSYNELAREKDNEKKTVRTYLSQIKHNLTGNKLYEEINKPKLLTHKDQVIYEDEHYTCFIPTFVDVKLWAKKAGNCMASCYLYNNHWDNKSPTRPGKYQLGKGMFLYICKKGQFGEPFNMTYIQPASSYDYSYGYDGSKKVKDIIADNIKFNNSTKDPKSPNYGKPTKKLFEGLRCTECKLNGGQMSGQPNCWDLTDYRGNQIQTEKSREQHYNFTLELRKRFGFEGSYYYQDFDRAMEKYYEQKKSKSSIIR